MKLAYFLLCSVFSMPLSAIPVTPERSALVPLGKVLPLTSQMQRVQQQLLQQPHNISHRLHLAQLYLQGARKPGFDNWFHQAQTLLSDVTPGEAERQLYALLQADIAQQQHQFDAALLILQQVLAREPANLNANLMAARIYLAQDNTASAQQACARLWRDLFLFSACSYEVAGRRGNVAQSYSALQQLYAQQPSLTLALDIWLRGILAEQAEMLNKPQQALQWLTPVLEHAPASLWLKWADLTLQYGDAQQVYAKLASLQQRFGLSDGLLLRLALSERVTMRGSQFIEQLEPRIALRLARGDTDHAGDMVHYFLRVKLDAKAALHWAKLNYASAKEPDDMRLLQLAEQALQQEEGK